MQHCYMLPLCRHRREGGPALLVLTPLLLLGHASDRRASRPPRQQAAVIWHNCTRAGQRAPASPAARHGTAQSLRLSAQTWTLAHLRNCRSPWKSVKCTAQPARLLLQPCARWRFSCCRNCRRSASRARCAASSSCRAAAASARAASRSARQAATSARCCSCACPCTLRLLAAPPPPSTAVAAAASCSSSRAACSSWRATRQRCTASRLAVARRCSSSCHLCWTRVGLDWLGVTEGAVAGLQGHACTLTAPPSPARRCPPGRPALRAPHADARLTCASMSCALCSRPRACWQSATQCARLPRQARSARSNSAWSSECQPPAGWHAQGRRDG